MIKSPDDSGLFLYTKFTDFWKNGNKYSQANHLKKNKNLMRGSYFFIVLYSNKQLAVYDLVTLTFRVRLISSFLPFLR